MSSPERSFMSPEQAREFYNLAAHPDNDTISEADRELAEHGITCVELPIKPEDFLALSRGYEICIKECPELLAQTVMQADTRHGGDIGHVRKEAKFDRRTGQQVSDPKSYIHFNEVGYPMWAERLRHGPKFLRDFIADGREIHDTLIRVAQRSIRELEGSHPNISNLYFPGGQSHTFMRLLRYDAYPAESSLSQAEVAKPHFDMGGATIQAFADAPGFWAAKDGVNGERQRHDSRRGQAQFFMGKGHEKMYGPNDRFHPLWHGVDRIVPAGVTLVPERTAVILFIDAPEVDYNVRSSDTLPYINAAAS